MYAEMHTKAWSLPALPYIVRSHDLGLSLARDTSHIGRPSHANRVTVDYLEKLLKLRQRGRALDVLGQLLDRSPSFRPERASARLRLTELVAQRGSLSRIARLLVAQFDTRFPVRSPNRHQPIAGTATRPMIAARFRTDAPFKCAPAHAPERDCGSIFLSP